ncbi:MAG: retention module-containing protein, partial [Gammaproteobacteria bacterium]
MATVTIGKIGNIEGSVEVVHADGSKGSLEQGALVYADDAISTAEDSNARIEFLDGTAMNIGPEFTAILGKDVFDPALIEDEGPTPAVVLESSDREIVPESGFVTAAEPGTIGFVEKAEGDVKVVGEDGMVRLLKTDDALYANDVLRVGSDGSVTIRMVDGSDLSFGPGTIARMGDSGVPTLASSEPAAITEAAQIATIIQEGRDPTEEAAAPAAGETTGNEGSDFIVIEPSHRAVTPTSGHDTHGFDLSFGLPEPQYIIPEEPNSIPTLIVRYGPSPLPFTAGGPGVVDENGLPARVGPPAEPEGTNEPSASEITDGDLEIDTGNEGLAKLEVCPTGGIFAG